MPLANTAQSDDADGIMRQRAHGTCLGPVQKPVRWGCDWAKADDISCFNRHWAERAGYWETTDFFAEEGKETKKRSGPVIFYDSVTSEPLFQAPVGRSWEDFVHESLHHGWPSFRDQEVISDRVRVLPDGETVSLDGTHLGHNLPDKNGNRYCINLVSVAGFAPDTPEGQKAQAAIDWDSKKSNNR
jgi:peptide methionine sulfoxide reductase MsrB